MFLQDLLIAVRILVVDYFDSGIERPVDVICSRGVKPSLGMGAFAFAADLPLRSVDSLLVSNHTLSQTCTYWILFENAVLVT